MIKAGDLVRIRYMGVLGRVVGHVWMDMLLIDTPDGLWEESIFNLELVESGKFV